jgi:transglutaminase-like putative cysteine protease
MKTAPLPTAALFALFSGIALAAGPHLPRLPVWIAGTATMLLAWRAWAAWQRLALPNKWLLYILAIGGVASVWMINRTLFGRDAGVTLLVLLVSLKLMEMRSLRDVVVVTFLCYFLALTNFFYSQSMPTAALIFATALVLTAALAMVYAPARPPLDSGRTAAMLMLQGAPVMLVLFFLFPRVQGPLWGMPTDAYGGMTGLSDSMTPGNISSLIQSDAIAFRAKFDGRPPDRRLLYWRGPVFWDFDGRTWTAGGVRLSGEGAHEPRGEPLNYEVTVEPHNRTWLFALDLPARTPPRAYITGDYQLMARSPVRQRLRYDMSSHLDYRATFGTSPSELDAAKRLPASGNPRARELAKRWRAESANDTEVMRKALAHFRSARLEYSLTPPLLDADPVDQFLFDTRSGFCEHFSSAFAFLMRAAGVPARIVTGYQGGEVNPIDGYLIVRQSDAHAWVEVLVDDQGWMRVDPTAAAIPARVESGLAAAIPSEAVVPLLGADLDWLRALRFNWEAANNYWNQWVLGYDPDRQREMLTRLGMRTPDWKRMTTWLFWIVGGILAVVALTMLRRGRPGDPAQAEWQRFCRKLARRGLARRPSEGPLAYAKRVATALPAHAADVASIRDLYVELRYGPAPGRAPLDALRARVRAFRP